MRSRCILSKFYIKPQQRPSPVEISAVVSYRNSTSNHNPSFAPAPGRVVVSYRNSTSNHNSAIANVSAAAVVSYRNSTSNHNYALFTYVFARVVSYRNSTSNHNLAIISLTSGRLYLIEILHQTTTSNLSAAITLSCILSKFYIKPQLMEVSSFPSARCILSKFYIKPQQGSSPGTARAVVSYRNSTSNHNVAAHSLICLMLYLIEILHQTTTCIR